MVEGLRYSHSRRECSIKCVNAGFQQFFSQPDDAMPPCLPDGICSLYEGKYAVMRRRVNRSRQEDKAAWRRQAAKKNTKNIG